LFAALEEALRRASLDRLHIPFGVGICGHVAETKETVNLKNAYEVRTIKGYLCT
jgi:putative methionine-R-sulfoxide reductase with GAF domain